MKNYSGSQPRYRAVKDGILSNIRSGKLKPGDRVPSEYELVAKYSIARMTANRALRELASEGFLKRVAGSGTFVSEGGAYSQPMAVTNIRDEIKRRGGRYSARILHLDAEEHDDFPELPKGTMVFHSVLLHLEGNMPLQLEDRLVNPEIAPDYLKQDFRKITPGDYLLGVAPVEKAEHVIEAIMPDFGLSADLKLEKREPCLLLTRRTWVQNIPASYVRFYHPGKRYRLGATFGPAKNGPPGKLSK